MAVKYTINGSRIQSKKVVAEYAGEPHLLFHSNINLLFYS